MPIIPLARQFRFTSDKSNEVLRKQFPCRPCAAKTIHRSQGDTVDHIVVDFSTDKKHAGLHYVGLSRVKAFEHLHILNLNESKIATSKDVKDEMTRLRGIPYPHTLYFPTLENAFTISALNVQSLPKHQKDLQCDLYIQQSTIICLCETHTCTDLIHSPVQDFIHFYDTHSGHGMCILSKVPISVEFKVIEGIDFALVDALDVKILSIYKPPHTPNTLFARILNEFMHNLPQNNTIVLGDFNIDLLSRALPPAIQNVLAPFKQLIINSTTDYGTLLDHIYFPRSSRVTSMEHGVWDNFYSDHKTIWCSYLP